MTRPTTGRRLSGAALMVALVGVAGCTATTDGHPANPTGSGTSSGSKRAADPDGATFTDPTTASRIRASATRDIATVNTYDYRSLPTFLAKGTAVTTGAFRTQFATTVRTVVTPNAAKARATQTATVNDVGLGAVSADGTTASVLAFLQLSVTSATTKATVSLATASAQLTKVDGKWLLSQVTTTPTASIGQPPGTAGLTAAVTAAGTATRLIASYRRASFDADFAAALAATTGQLRTDLTKLKESTRSTLTKGKFDLRATVRTSGAEKAVGKRAVVLVSLDGYTSTDPAPKRQNVIVTVTLRDGAWLASDITAAAAK